MNDVNDGLLARFMLALRSAWRIMLDRDFAQTVQRGAQSTEVPAPARAAQPVPQPAVSTDAALQLLALLQQEGRLIDFLEENVTAYTDAEIGGAARVVHEGCRKILREYVQIAPIRAEAEGDRVTLPAGFDATTVRLTGNVVGQAPFTGTLMHRGWRVQEMRLPKLTDGHDARIIAAAEVEL